MIDKEYLFWVFSGFTASVIIFTVLINTILLRFVKTLGTRANTDELIRWSSQKKPSVGGIGFFIIFLLSLACYAILLDPIEVFQNNQALALIGTCSIAFLMGLADDAYNTKPLLKFLTQVGCGVLLTISGIQIDLFQYEWLNMGLTIMWVVGIMNSINMLDNMDAITSVVSIFICIECLLIMFLFSQSDSFDFFVVLGVCAGLVGFLFHNWNPSKIFMGDTGSQFLGVFLAAISIKYLWNAPIGGLEVQSKQIVLVLLAFILPIADTATVTINRLLKKSSPFIGGKDHTTHHLSFLGLSDSQVAMVFAGISFVSTFLIVVITNFINQWDHLYTALFVGYFLLIFGALYTITKISKPTDNAEKNQKPD